MRRTAMPDRAAPLKRTTALGRSPLARSAVHSRAPKPKRHVASRPTIPAKVRAALTARSLGLCEMSLPGCTQLAIDPAHRVRTGMGGRRGAAKTTHDVLSNLTHACRACHAWTHRNPARAYEIGLMLRDGSDSLKEPVAYRGRPVWLTDDGAVLTSDPAEEAP